jgi:hypothetical protein
MAEDNNVDVELVELLGQLADKQEETRSKQIAVTTVEQAMLNSIMRLPPVKQVTALRGFIERMERKLSEMSVQTAPAAQKATTSASCNVAGACAAVAAAPATYPSSRTSGGSPHRRAIEPQVKRRQQEEDSEHPENVGQEEVSELPENVGAAGARRAPHGSGTFASPDSLAVRKIRPPRDSLPVRGMSQMQRQQTTHFIRFAVPFVHEKQGTGRLVQMDLVTAYAAANKTDGGKEEVLARVNTIFRNSLVTMRSIQNAAMTNDVESAIAEIGRTRVHYADESLERCMELRPEYSAFIQFCIGLRDGSAEGRGRRRVSWKSMAAQWELAPAFDPSINLRSMTSSGIINMNKINPVGEIKKEETCRLSGPGGQSEARRKVRKRRRAISGGSHGESSDGDTGALA